MNKYKVVQQDNDITINRNGQIVYKGFDSMKLANEKCNELNQCIKVIITDTSKLKL